MITIDRREAQEALDHHHISIPDALGLPYALDTLDSGDFAFLDRNDEPEGIERCEIGNLTEKIISGQLEGQLERCQDSYAHTILLIEGVYDKVDSLLAIHKKSERGYFRVRVFPHIQYDRIKAFETRVAEYGIELCHTPNFDCSISTIRTIYKQRTESEEMSRLFKKTKAMRVYTKYTRNPSVIKLMSLVPRLPERVAAELINKYGSIWSILNTDEQELLTVDGFGKTLLNRLKEGIGK